MNNYSELFQEAKNRTEKFNFALPSFKEDVGCLLTGEVLEMLPVLIYITLAVFPQMKSLVNVFTFIGSSLKSSVHTFERKLLTH